MKKIVIIGLLGRGGNIYYTASLANAASRKNDVCVVIPSYSDKKLFNSKIKIVTVDAPLNVTKTVINFFNNKIHKKLLEEIDKIKPDIVHFNHNHIYYLRYINYLKKKYLIYWTYHDPMLHSGDFSIKSLGDLLIHRTFERKADKIFVHGKIWKKFLVKKRKISARKVVSIYHGTFNLVSGLGNKNIKPEKNTFLFFGRIVKYKGIDTLLKGMSLVVKDFKSAKLIIAGSGDFKPYEKYLTPEIKNNIKIINRFIPDTELANIFRSVEFVVLPYDDATQSGVIPIAYSFSKAVIASDVGALSDVVIDGRTGYLVKPGEYKILSKRIIELLENRTKTKQLGLQAFKWMKKELDWKKIVEKSYN